MKFYYPIFYRPHHFPPLVALPPFNIFIHYYYINLLNFQIPTNFIKLSSMIAIYPSPNPL